MHRRQQIFIFFARTSSIPREAKRRGGMNYDGRVMMGSAEEGLRKKKTLKDRRGGDDPHDPQAHDP